MRKIITITESIIINSNKLKVWNFTQDFNKRNLWDKTILEYKIISKKPRKLVWLKMKGGIVTTLKYKLCDKPNKTSLKMHDTKSLLIKGGGGSWKYSEKDGKTIWVQTNSLEIKFEILYFLFGWLIKKELARNTKKAMQNARILIEKEIGQKR